MLISLVQGKRSADKGDVTVIKKTLSDMGGTVGIVRHLAAPAEIHAPQEQGASVLILDPFASGGWLHIRITSGTNATNSPNLSHQPMDIISWNDTELREFGKSQMFIE
jgi:hypothetical protein